MLGLVAFLWLAALAGARAAARDPAQRLDPPAATAEIPKGDVDVVVPARNEEKNVGELLESLRAQTKAPVSIAVVDDASADRTGAIVLEHAAKDRRVTRIAGSGPPEGWTGKTAALSLGDAAGKSEWVLFVDADVRLDSAALAAMLAEAQRRGWDGISLWGTWEVPSFAARLLQSVIGGFVRGAHPIPRVNDASKPDAFLNGQILLIRRASMRELGGWESVRTEVLEDVALARRAKRRGIRIGMLRAPELMRVVPYRSFGEAWRGYLKNFVAGAGGTGKALGAALAIFIASVLPFVVLASEIFHDVPSAPRFIASAAACAAALAYRAGTARLFHHPAYDAVFHPFANAAFVALILSAVVRKWTGAGATWKGRVVH